MSNYTPNITPIGIVVAVLIICILALIAIPRLREASRGEEASGSPKVLATFGWDSSGVAEGGEVGVVVTCGTCADGLPLR